MPSLATQLSVLAELEHPVPASAIAEAIDEDEFVVVEAVDELEEAGLVEREGFGAKVRVVPTTPDLPRLANDARGQLSDEGWQAVFAEDRARVLHVLERVGEASLAGRVVDRPVQAVEGIVEALEQAGVLEHGEGLQIAPGNDALVDLLDEVEALRARRELTRLDPDAELVWHLGPELLFASSVEIAHPDVTYGAFSTFDDFGVQAPRDETYYYRTHRKLDAGDAILQALLVEDRPRTRSLATLAYELKRPDAFGLTARVYGLEDVARAIEAYVEAREDREGFEPWSEYARLRKKHGLA